jgi:hypothetical protein
MVGGAGDEHAARLLIPSSGHDLVGWTELPLPISRWSAVPWKKLMNGAGT